MMRVTLICNECTYVARRNITNEPGNHGITETRSEPARCPNGHGQLIRKDGRQVVPAKLSTEDARPRR